MAFKVGNGQGYNFVKMELRSRRIVQLLVGGLVDAVIVAADKRRLPTAFQPNFNSHPSFRMTEEV